MFQSMSSLSALMQLSFSKLGKKFYHRWIFRNLDCLVSAPTKLVLVGSNGSGKSTLMRILAGQLSPTEGKLSYTLGGKRIPLDKIYRHISWTAPYLDIYPDLNFLEHLRLHFRFKTCLLESPEAVIDRLRLSPHKDKKLRYYSSGMLQRAKVGIALFTQSDILLLDEPTSNMDSQNAQRMLELIRTYSKGRLLILASNMDREYEGTEHLLRLDDKGPIVGN